LHKRKQGYLNLYVLILSFSHYFIVDIQVVSIVKLPTTLGEFQEHFAPTYSFSLKSYFLATETFTCIMIKDFFMKLC